MIRPRGQEDLLHVLMPWSWHMPFCLSLQTKIGAGRLMGPKGVAVDRNGHIIVVDNKACCVFIFQSNGKLVAKFGSRGTSERQFAGAPSSSSPMPQAQLGRVGKPPSRGHPCPARESVASEEGDCPLPPSCLDGCLPLPPVGRWVLPDARTLLWVPGRGWVVKQIPSR